MSKIDHNKLRKKGIILKRHSGGNYRVKLESVDIEILATIASKFRIPRKLGRGTSKPHLIPGDKVIVEIPPNQTKIERGQIVEFAK